MISGRRALGNRNLSALKTFFSALGPGRLRGLERARSPGETEGGTGYPDFTNTRSGAGPRL
jgi:hypothetical protein